LYLYQGGDNIFNYGGLVIVWLTKSKFLSPTIGDYWQTCWDLNKRVKEEIEKAGLTIPFPQRSVHVVANPGTAEAAEAGA